MFDNHNAERSSPPSAHLDNSPSADADPKPSCSGVPEARGSQPGDHLGAMRDRMAKIVDRELQRMENGEIDQLSQQHNSMLTQLSSLKVGSSTSTPVNLSVPTYAGVLFTQKSLSITPNDVRSLLPLTGSADTDVA